MALKTNSKVATVHVDPFSLSAGIQILSGNAVQVFNRESQEYITDRTLVPLLLLPVVNTLDPEGVMNGEQPLTGVEWYEGVPSADGSNRIVGNDDYEISSGTVENFPMFALKMKKNVDPNTPMEIFAIAIFSDKRRNTEVRVERSIRVYTSLYDAQNYSVKINQPKAWTIDPLRVIPDSEGYWKFSMTAQLYSGKELVADEHAAYWWQIYENGVWRDITDDDLAVWIDGKGINEHWTKTLTFDARMITGEVAFRVRAAYYEDERPPSPTSEELQDSTSIKVEMAHSLSADIRQNKGIKISPTLNTSVGYECVLSDNKGIVGVDKDHLFKIEWYARSEKPGSSEILLGEGRAIEFTPSVLGFEAAYTISIFALVKLYSGHALVMENDAAVMHNEAYVIQPTYE